mgnify:CR=1 FL=1
MRVLIVDDHVMFAESLARLLVGREGITDVVVADSVAAVRSTANQLEPDVAVIDWRMPGREGVDVVRWARRNERPTGLLMLTARDTPPDRIGGLDVPLQNPLGSRRVLSVS